MARVYYPSAGDFHFGHLGEWILSFTRDFHFGHPDGIDLQLLEHVSPIEWDNVVLYGQYILDRKLVRRRPSRPLLSV